MSLILPKDLETKTYEEFLKSLTIKKTFKSALSVTICLLADGFAEIERKNLRVNEILLNPVTYSEIRRIKKYPINFESRASNLKKGLMANLWGADIVASSIIPNNTILILSEIEPKTAVILKTREGTQYPVKELIKQKDELIRFSRELNTIIKKINESLYDLTTKESNDNEA